MLAKDQVINTYRALNNWRSFRLKLFIEGIIIGILSGLIISFFRWSLHLVETNREHIYTFLKKQQTGIGPLFGSSLLLSRNSLHFRQTDKI